MGLWQCVLLGGAGGALVEVLDVLGYVRAWQRARQTPPDGSSNHRRR